MANEENTPHPDFLKGFNEGYIIAQQLPDLAAKLSKAVGNSERSDGFQAGYTQYSDEKNKAKYPDWLTGSRKRSHDKEDKGDREPEKD